MNGFPVSANGTEGQADKALTQLPIHARARRAENEVHSAPLPVCLKSVVVTLCSSSPPPQFQAQSLPSTSLPLSAAILCPHPPSAKPSLPPHHPSCTKTDDSIFTSKAMHFHYCLGVSTVTKVTSCTK